MAKPMVEFSAGRVLVRTGKVELGQGLHTALAQIAADELGVPVSQVHMLPVDTDSSPDQGVTSGSQSVQEAGRALREACAELRPQAAHRAAVGRSLPRPELERLFAGASHFIHDLQPKGLLHGRVLHPPRLDAEVLAWDEAAARATEGLIQLQRDGRLFGLLAPSSAAADQALARLSASLRWTEADPALIDDPDDFPHRPAALRVVAESGTAAPAAQTLSARYSKSWIAHASLAPSCALARWADGRLWVWSHSQGIFNLQRDLALAFGIDVEAVRVTHVPGAGCYGHNGADDVAFDAAWLARGVPGRTVRVVWTRADELSHSPFGPAMRMELRAGLDAQGCIVDWQHEVWSPGHSRRPGRDASPALLGAWQVAKPHPVPPSIDMPLARGGGAERNGVPGYDFASLSVRCHSVVTARRSSALRSLGAFGNVFAAESFIDEIAHATATDPLALRRRHLQHDARGLAVLEAAAAQAGWSGPLPSDGCGHGIGYARYKGTGAWCAVVAEVHAAEVLRVLRLTIAVDVGLAVNPDGVIAQIEGGAIQATSWTLKESAKAAQAGWSDYPVLRFSEVPEVEVVLMPSDAPSLGAGEASIGPTAAAIANALFDALGVRVRDLPLTPRNIIAAMDSA